MPNASSAVKTTSKAEDSSPKTIGFGAAPSGPAPEPHRWPLHTAATVYFNPDLPGVLLSFNLDRRPFPAGFASTLPAPVASALTSMGKKRKYELDLDVERSMYTSFVTAANAVSQLYTQGVQQQRRAASAASRGMLVRVMADWLL